MTIDKQSKEFTNYQQEKDETINIQTMTSNIQQLNVGLNKTNK